MKNKILLYFPDTGGYNFTPPYELLFQANAIKNSQFELIFADSRKDEIYQIFDLHKEELLLLIVSTLIKYTSITITPQYIDGLKIAEYAKNNCGVLTLWTGLAATIQTDNIINKEYNDFVLKGISENKLNDIIDCIKHEKSFSTIKSLVYKKDGLVIKNDNDKYFNSLNDYGNFDLSCIDLKPYIHNNTLDYIASTGCINECSFCSVPYIYKRHWNHNSIQNIISHLEHIFDHYPEIKIIHFRDDNFLVNKTFVFELFRKLEEKKIYFIWSAQTSVNVLKKYSDEELKELKSRGCNNISIGVESGDNYILEKVTKLKTTKTASKEQIKRLIKSDITVSVTSIISFPYNNGRDFNITLKFLMKLKLLYPSLSMYCTILQPIPETEIFNELINSSVPISDVLLKNNTWTNELKKSKLKKFENFYFIFDRKDFYNSLPEGIGKDLKLINKFFSPIIRFRFWLGITCLLWEYEITKKLIHKIKTKHGINTNSNLTDIGIRHLTSNYNFGFRKKQI